MRGSRGESLLPWGYQRSVSFLPPGAGGGATSGGAGCSGFSVTLSPPLFVLVSAALFLPFFFGGSGWLLRGGGRWWRGTNAGTGCCNGAGPPPFHVPGPPKRSAVRMASLPATFAALLHASRPPRWATSRTRIPLAMHPRFRAHTPALSHVGGDLSFANLLSVAPTGCPALGGWCSPL